MSYNLSLLLGKTSDEDENAPQQTFTVPFAALIEENRTSRHTNGYLTFREGKQNSAMTTKLQRRASGVLLHPTSLPGGHGIGDLGRASHQFVEFLADAGQQWWQMLPIGPLGLFNSPYASPSTFASNPLLIDLDQLVDRGLLTTQDVSTDDIFSETEVNYEAVERFKEVRLHKAFEAFNTQKHSVYWDRFEAFCQENDPWLLDYALYCTLKQIYHGKAWTDWDAAVRVREPDALGHLYDRRKKSVRFQQFLQFIFHEQWSRLRKHCEEKGISLVGDIPMFVAHDSVDVWANPQYFWLDDSGQPEFVAGVPPDYFSHTGQIWGNPLYRWSVLRLNDYDWWCERIRSTTTRFDVVRMDHFIGFHRYWEIPADASTANLGQWMEGPGDEFFERLRDQIGEVELIAEDLGEVTPEVRTLANKFGFPGIRVLQFAFGSDDPTEDDRPENYPEQCVIYTGTHDNDTTVGWFSNMSDKGRTTSQEEMAHERNRVLQYVQSDGRDIHWDLIRVAYQSPSNTAIIPAQDLLGLGSESRMNVPGTAEGNWEWRLTEGALTPDIAARLRQYTEEHGRLHQPSADKVR